VSLKPKHFQFTIETAVYIMSTLRGWIDWLDD